MLLIGYAHLRIDDNLDKNSWFYTRMRNGEKLKKYVVIPASKFEYSNAYTHSIVLPLMKSNVRIPTHIPIESIQYILVKYDSSGQARPMARIYYDPELSTNRDKIQSMSTHYNNHGDGILCGSMRGMLNMDTPNFNFVLAELLSTNVIELFRDDKGRQAIRKVQA